MLRSRLLRRNSYLILGKDWSVGARIFQKIWIVHGLGLSGAPDSSSTQLALFEHAPHWRSRLDAPGICGASGGFTVPLSSKARSAAYDINNFPTVGGLAWTPPMGFCLALARALSPGADCPLVLAHLFAAGLSAWYLCLHCQRSACGRWGAPPPLCAFGWPTALRVSPRGHLPFSAAPDLAVHAADGHATLEISHWAVVFLVIQGLEAGTTVFWLGLTVVCAIVALQTAVSELWMRGSPPVC